MYMYRPELSNSRERRSSNCQHDCSLRLSTTTDQMQAQAQGICLLSHSCPCSFVINSATAATITSPEIGSEGDFHVPVLFGGFGSRNIPEWRSWLWQRFPQTRTEEPFQGPTTSRA